MTVTTNSSRETRAYQPPRNRTRGRYPTLSWEVRLALRTQIGRPDTLYLYEAWTASTASAALCRSLLIGSTVGKNILSTPDQITLHSNSQLPHVRSDLRQYAQEGDVSNIVRLQADYLFQPAENCLARASAGLFEQMFGGVGGEIL
jgi:hypothetical protein